MTLLREKSQGLFYCAEAFDIYKGLKGFRFDSFRKFGGEPLQEKAAKAAVDGKSLLAVFHRRRENLLHFSPCPLMSGENSKCLTVVISPCSP